MNVDEGNAVLAVLVERLSAYDTDPIPFLALIFFVKIPRMELSHSFQIHLVPAINWAHKSGGIQKNLLYNT